MAEDTSASPATTRSHLGNDLKIKGNLTATGTVEVMGEIDGDIDAKHLIIGSAGRVTGNVSADSVEVQGYLKGSASCHDFTIRSRATASVQVSYERLTIEAGATVEGRFTRANKG